MGGCTEITGRRPPDHFIPIVGAIISAVSGSVKAGLQDIGGKIGAIATETSGKIAANAAVTDTLMAEMKPLKKNNAFYIIAGVALLAIIIIGIILFKTKK